MLVFCSTGWYGMASRWLSFFILLFLFCSCDQCVNNYPVTLICCLLLVADMWLFSFSVIHRPLHCFFSNYVFDFIGVEFEYWLNQFMNLVNKSLFVSRTAANPVFPFSMFWWTSTSLGANILYVLWCRLLSNVPTPCYNAGYKHYTYGLYNTKVWCSVLFLMDANLIEFWFPAVRHPAWPPTEGNFSTSIALIMYVPLLLLFIMARILCKHIEEVIQINSSLGWRHRCPFFGPYFVT